MAVLERSELQASTLADLHAIADQLGLDGFRRLRKDDLIEAILGEGPPANGSAEPTALDSEEPSEHDPDRAAPSRAKRRGGRSSAGRSRRSATAQKDEDGGPA